MPPKPVCRMGVAGGSIGVLCTGIALRGIGILSLGEHHPDAACTPNA